MSKEKPDLTDFNELLSMQSRPKEENSTQKQQNKSQPPDPKVIAQQQTILKVYRQYQQREYERMRHPEQFPPDYFFSALAELVLGD